MPIPIPRWGKRYEVKCYRCGQSVPLGRKRGGNEKSEEAICPHCGASNFRPHERSRLTEVTVVVVLAFVGVWLVSVLLRVLS
jgi:hypothetical protein